MRRFPIRMTTIQDESGDEKLIVICDDGTMWMYVWGDEDAPDGRWLYLAAIPPGPDPQQQRDLMVDAPERQPE